MSFVLPGAKKSLLLLHDMLEQRKGAVISLFSHADPTGDDARNKEWSGRRGRAVLGVLIHQPTIWKDLYRNPIEGDNWGPPAALIILSVLTKKSGKAAGEPYYSGTFSPDENNALAQAVGDFQADEGLDKNGELSDETLEKLFQRYFDYLTTKEGTEPKVLGSEAFLAKLSGSDYRGDVQGCSEFNPLVVFSSAEQILFDSQGHEIQRSAENAANRRVLVLFFPPGSEVDIQSWPCPSAVGGEDKCQSRFWSNGPARRSPSDKRRLFESTRDTMACRFYHRFVDKSPCERSVQLAGLHLRILDGEGTPKKHQPYQLQVGDFTFHGFTGEDGVLVHAIPVDAVQGKLTMNDFERTLLIGPQVDADEDAGSSMRLQNLAFGSGGPGQIVDKESAVQRFLASAALPIAKALGAEAIEALRKRYGA
ncbi:MAG: hypothetical protein IPK82_35890 [Polyangiaceae bacterium]|nr:hypothetical protein [Polyangiaceae bacterium]